MFTDDLAVSELVSLLLKTAQANLYYLVYITGSFWYQASLQHVFTFAKGLDEENITTPSLGNFC